MGSQGDTLSGQSVAQQLRSALFTAWSLPLLYLTVLVVAYVRYGMILQFTLGAAALVVLPVAAYFAKSREFLKNSALVVSVLLTYEALQGITGALVNSGKVVSLAGIDKQILGFDLPAAVQTSFTSSTVTIIATFFYSIHFFLVLAALVLFWFTNRSVYKGYTYALILTSYLGLMTFVILPSSPPWFAGAAQNLLSSGLKLMPSSIQSVQQAALAIESDKFAAFPSLHAAYATLFAIYTIRLNPKLGLVSVPILVGVLFSTLYLGQHYFVDLVGGMGYSAASVLAIDWLIRRRSRSNALEAPSDLRVPKSV